MNKVIVGMMMLSLAGCASRASSIAPVAIPTSNYAGLSCSETKDMLAQKTAMQIALTKQQNNAATGDAIGVFLVFLPLGSVFGADKEGELAQAKGEVLALTGAVSINCKGEVEAAKIEAAAKADALIKEAEAKAAEAKAARKPEAATTNQ